MYSYLLASGDFTGKDTTEGIEATLIGSGDHLGDVGHQWTIGITVFEGKGDGIVLGTFVQLFHTVVLGGQWRWQVDGNHLEESLTSWEPVTHEALQEWFALELYFSSVQPFLLLIRCTSKKKKLISHLTLRSLSSPLRTTPQTFMILATSSSFSSIIFLKAL